MQRIRYGLTGLALVFLIVLLGTAVIRSGDEPGNNVSDANAAEERSEPLAELGVAPGQGTDTNEVNQPAAQPR